MDADRTDVGPDGGPLPFAQLWVLAAEAGDDTARLALLRGADLALPTRPDGVPHWPIATWEGSTWVTAWTSPEAMQEVATAGPWRVASFVELVTTWPDARWGLAVDLGTPHPLLLEPGTVVRLVAPDPVDELAADPDREIWVQQLVPLAGIDPLLRGRETRVSGHVQRATDLAHIGAPTVLLDALARADEELALITDEGSVHLLRWPVLGAELYRVPRGAPDPEGCAARAGWVVEPGPGTGLGPGRTTPVREYRTDAVALPHGAALVELDRHGQETERARYDALRGVWQLIARLPPTGRGPA